MIFIHYTPAGHRRAVDLQDIYAGRGAMLVGGAPSLKEQTLELLEQRGVLSMAINNAALHFRPTLWVSGDRPECYEPRILLDPTIMKFGNIAHADVELDARYGNRRYRDMPNQYFYMPEDNVPWDEYFGRRKTVPWYHNSLFVGIHILYHLGVRKLVLGGSDFGFSKDGGMYAHRTALGEKERRWNTDVYAGIVHELRRLKPMFEKAGLELYDCSANSRVGQVYPHITMAEGVKVCLTGFPEKDIDPAELPHCSKFAPPDLDKKIAKWAAEGNK